MAHEFVLGPEHVQDAHEMAAEVGMGHGEAEEEAMAMMDLEPGATDEATVTFDEPGEILYGCHEPGHYDAGIPPPTSRRPQVGTEIRLTQIPDRKDVPHGPG